MRKVKLSSKEGREFLVDEQVARMSGVVNRLMADLGLLSGDGAADASDPVPLLVVSGEPLEKIVQWCTHHTNDLPAPENEEQQKYVYTLTSWDQAFFSKMDMGLFYETLCAATYMEISSYVDVALKRLASMIKGKNVVEMRRILHVENDFTPEQEDEVEKKYGWYNNAN